MSYVGKITAGGTTHLVGSTLYGTCDTAAATAAKVVVCANFDKLLTGVTIKVKFTNTNTVANPTLNVNSTGAIAIMRYGTTRPSTSVQTSWYAGAVISFTYDGTYWMMDDWTYTADGNTDVRPSAYCETAAATAAKVASCTNYTATANTLLHILMRYANTSASALTLNVNSQGAKPIYINGTASSASNYTLPAGTYIVYYDGTNYYFNTNGSVTANSYNLVDGTVINGIWTNAVNGLVGDTAAAFTDSNITSASTIQPYCENASGMPITLYDITITPGKATITFPALTEATTFKLLISPVISAQSPALINYTTSEQETGQTWIDGKKIYQKTIEKASSFTTGAWATLEAITLSNLISADITFQRNNQDGLIYAGGSSIFPETGNTNKVAVRYYNGNIQYSIIGFTDVTKLIVTIKYTKTT